MSITVTLCKQLRLAVAHLLVRRGTHSLTPASRISASAYHHAFAAMSMFCQTVARSLLGRGYIDSYIFGCSVTSSTEQLELRCVSW